MADRDNFLDCIRALSVSMVFATHYHGWLLGGSIGVSSFFCLSGYLIARILLGLSDFSIPNIWKFIFRRFMRVWPMMAFQIAFVAVLMTLLKPEWLPGFLPSVPGLMTFTGGYFAWSGYSPAILWTLRAEFWFYVFFPFALYLAGRRNIVSVVIVGIVISWIYKLGVGHTSSGLFMKYTPLAHFFTKLRLLHFTLMYLDQLMIGAACAAILARSPLWLRFYSNRLYLVAAIAFIVWLSTIPFRQYDLVFYAQTTVTSLATAFIILHQAERPLKGKYEPAAMIGRISFSIYLLHAVAIDYLPLDDHFGQRISVPMMIFTIIGSSFLTYKLIEIPFINLSKRLARFSDSRPKINDLDTRAAASEPVPRKITPLA